nr:PTS transporter subunit IIC [Streptococcus pneumoniae]
MGGPVIMLIILTVLALLFGVKFSKALEGGIKLAIALTGIGAIIGMLNGAFSASLAKFVENTGIQLSITDVGWAPLATITWGSAWTLYFLLIMLIVNVVMLAMKKTDTLDVDIFDIWHLSITGLLIKWYADNNGVSQGVSLLIATAAIVLVGVLKIINSDLMKPTFDDLLKTWDGQTQLLFLGDLIDRGEDSHRVLEMVKDLVDNQGAICLSGNHEYMFLTWLDDPEESYDHYRRNGGDTTINSILGRPLDAPVDGVEDAKRVAAEAADLVEFIRQMPFVVETDKYIFVHAGIDLTLDDWHETTDYKKVWLRKPFHGAENHTGKTIVFGHTPVYGLLQQERGTSELWTTEDGKIGMDGGAVYGGVLHGIVFTDQGMTEHHFIENDGFVAED